jgi:formate hydrogenlyase subunit 3/multisubunit Na+/H+ antiporter MnhD subunit
MAFSSVFLVWFRGAPESLGRLPLPAGARGGGVCLLAGMVLHYQATGGHLAFNGFDVANPRSRPG